MDIWTELSPSEQAAIVGLVVSGVMYLARFIKPSWFENESAAAKFQRTAAAVLISGATVLAKTLSTGSWQGVGAFLFAWAVAYGIAEGLHTTVSRTAAVTTKPEVSTNC
jgi:hypothetical protein